MGRLVDVDRMQPEDIPKAVLEGEVERELLRRQNAIRSRQAQEAVDRAQEAAAPGTLPSARVLSETYRRSKKRPVSDASDRDLVGPVLRHWRTTHGLTLPQAQMRIGLAPSSQTWWRWETGRSAPSYRMLLRVLAVTGMRAFADDALVELPPELRMQAERAQARERMAKRVSRRERRRPR